LPADKIRVKPNFVADPGPRLCAPEGSDVVLYVGRLVPEKGVEELVRAWDANRPAGLRLCIIGDGPLRPRLDAFVPPGVELVGSLPPAAVRRRMLSARALVFPSRWFEPFGLVVVEAMAAGLPVIASGLGGSAELLGDRTDELLNPSDPASWRESFGRLVDERWLRGTAKDGRARYEERFSPSANLRMLEDAYQAVAARPASRQ
jgi:glycosyltransferase involved in cell wall biosynthesis